MPRLRLGQTKPRVYWVLGDLALIVKWLGLEADHSLASSGKIKSELSCTSTHSTCLHDMYMDDFYFNSSVSTVTRLWMG